MEAADSRKLEQRKAELEEKEKESLQVIKEDLSKWLRRLLESDITAGEFLAHLDTGVLLCKLAHRIQQAARQQPKKTKIPLNDVRLNVFARKESFHARDNAANFIKWCRGMDVEESVMFESDGLVLHKDERRVVLCILEVARIAGELGLDIPKLIELEREIDKLEEGKKSGGTEVPSNEEVKSEGPPRPKRRRQETLDDKLLIFLNKCVCCPRLVAISHGGGKFHITTPAGRKMNIYVRILSDRVMVRVGGGWDTIEHFLLKHDPCRAGVKVSAASLCGIEGNKTMATPISKAATLRPSRCKSGKDKARSIRTPSHDLLKSSSTPSLPTSVRKRRAFD